MPRLSKFQQLHPTIDVRVTTSTELADFARDGVDVGIRYGHGKWQGLRTDWLMADELFPVCSPALLKGEHPIRDAGGSQRTTRCSTPRTTWRTTGGFG